LTTAAGIWTTASIGMAVSLGFYLIAIFTTALILLVFVALDRLKKDLFLNDKNSP